MAVGRGALRAQAEAPELDEAYGGKEVSREEVDEWLGGFDSEGEDHSDEWRSDDEEDDEEDNEEDNEDEDEEEEGGETKKSLKTKNAVEAERLHRELMSADRQKKRDKTKIDILGRDATVTDAEKSEHARNQSVCFIHITKAHHKHMNLTGNNNHQIETLGHSDGEQDSDAASAGTCEPTATAHGPQRICGRARGGCRAGGSGGRAAGARGRV